MENKFKYSNDNKRYHTLTYYYKEKFNTILSDKVFLENVIKDGAKKADYIANKTLRKVKKKVGFI